jgi:hypothetical protein
MSTLTTRRKRTTPASQTTLGNVNSLAFAAAIADFEMVIYSTQSTPLYELITAYGKVECSNSIDSAFQSFTEVRESLQPQEAGFLYNEDYNQFTLAMRMHDGGIGFAGLLHDKDGNPEADEDLILCRVRALRNFELEGKLIIEKGKEFLKALPESYVQKIS